MTQEEKQLLLKDISARLPYNVVIRCTDNDTDYKCFLTTDILNELLHNTEYYDYKPYLRPMSSMTEEENAILNNISNKDRGYEEDEDGWIRCDSIHTKWGVWPDGCAKLLDYLNSIHVDYRGLIHMGLALEATEGMYKTE